MKKNKILIIILSVFLILALASAVVAVLMKTNFAI